MFGNFRIFYRRAKVIFLCRKTSLNNSKISKKFSILADKMKE